MPSILLTIGMLALALAVLYVIIAGVAESIWGTIEDDIAKQEGYDNIEE